MTKMIKLEEIKTLTGNYFREVETNDDGSPILDLRKDSEGNPVMQIPRDPETGAPVPSTQPEQVYMPRSKEVKEALPLLLKRLYLEMPLQKTTRQDTINGTLMFDQIAASPEGYLELSDEIYKWINTKLQDEGAGKDDKDKGIGLAIFGKNLQVVERALDNTETPKTYASKTEAREAAAAAAGN